MVTAKLARKLLATHGKLRSQPAEDWTGDFPFPPAVADFYRSAAWALYGSQNHNALPR
jgi:hypothetical protein